MAKKKHTPRSSDSAAPKKSPIPAEEPRAEAETALTEPDEPTAETPTPEAESVTETESAPEETAPAEEAASEPEAPAAEAETPAADADNSDEKEYNFRALAADITKVLKRYDLPEMLLTRCIALYFFISGFWVIYLRKKSNYRPVDNWREFVGEVTNGRTLTCTLIFLIFGFITLCCIASMLPKKRRVSDHYAAIGSVIFFSVAMLWRVNNFFMSLAVAFVALIFIYYVLSKLPSRKPFERISWKAAGIVSLIAVIAMTIFIASGTIYKHKIFGTACHDFGLFVQMFHSLSNSVHAITTCERDTALSHFYIHSSYIYYLLAPFYKLFPHEATLLIAQAILAMGGAIPMFFIAKRHNVKGIALIFLTFSYVFCLSVVCPCFYDFHENAFLPTLLMWLFYAIDRRNTVLMWIMTVLVCIVKEDAPLYTVCIGLFIFFEFRGDKKRWQGLLMTVLSGAYMLFITNWLTKNGDGTMMTSTRFGILTINPDGGLTEVVKNVLLDPSYFFSLLIHEDTLNFFLKVMAPLLFIPFLTKKIHRYWLMIPFLIMNMTIGAGYGYAANVDFHYVFGPICLLIYTVVLNLDDFGEEKQHDLSILLGTAAIIFFVGLPLHHLDMRENYLASQDGFTAVEECLDRIPEEGRVCASAFMVSHCAEREEIYLFDGNDTNMQDQTRTEDHILNPERYDFIVFGPDSELGRFSIPVLESMGWTVYDEVPHRVVVYVSPSYQG